MNRIFHVSVLGSDKGDGSRENPFRTITKAAEIAQSGDTVIVHEGTYREWVKPVNSGHSSNKPITYMAAEGEKVIIKGSEIIKSWELVEGTVWKVVIPNYFFGEYNPYREKIYGDWFIYPEDSFVHAGDVYLNGKSFYEVSSISEVINPKVRDKGYTVPLSNRVEYLLNPKDSIYVWYAEVDDKFTTIYANFHGANPNEELTEINVRKCCFFPERIGINYITVKGFEMAHAATLWAPPTSYQQGLIGANWAKGWVIEDNIIHDSKCSGISIGKEYSTGDNECAKFQQKSGYQYQLEAVFKALEIGWSKEKIGSHIIRNNIIYDCGQNGIVGNLGCVFSEIYNNHIYNIGVKHEFFGWEIAGIKFHAPIDVKIYGNRIHNCTLGLWLDWQAQGTRVSSNLLYNNDRDCTIEVTHGPLLIDNNIFGSKYNFDNHAQGTAFINNLFCGTMCRKKILDRATPYHFPHSTKVKGYSFVYSGDDRFYNNIFVGGMEIINDFFCGTNGYNNCSKAYEEYIKKIIDKGRRDEEKFVEVEQPVYIDGNIYLNGAKDFKYEKNKYCNDLFNPKIKIIEKGSTVYLEIEINKEILNVHTMIHSTNTLGTVRIVDTIYDDPNGKDIIINTDYFGNKRSLKPKAGPIESLKLGLNKIKVW